MIGRLIRWVIGRGSTAVKAQILYVVARGGFHLHRLLARVGNRCDRRWGKWSFREEGIILFVDKDFLKGIWLILGVLSGCGFGGIRGVGRFGAATVEEFHRWQVIRALMLHLKRFNQGTSTQDWTTGFVEITGKEGDKLGGEQICVGWLQILGVMLLNVHHPRNDQTQTLALGVNGDGLEQE